MAKGGLAYAERTGAEAIQIFVTNPRAWRASPLDQEQASALRRHVTATGFPVFVHAPYLINIGSPDPETRSSSASLLGECLRRAKLAGARGVVVHTGSAITPDREAGLKRMRESLLPVLDSLGPGWPELLLEPMAGQGQMLCATISDVGPYLDALDWHPRAMLCLDTCHLYAAGHDLAAPGGVGRMLGELAQVADGRLRLIHANDSRDDHGSRRDRHVNIGHGKIGTAPFGALLRHGATTGVPFIVETPDADNGQARDIATLKRLRDGGRTG
jgi:deoxyribonuclease-4